MIWFASLSQRIFQSSPSDARLNYVYNINLIVSQRLNDRTDCCNYVNMKFLHLMTIN